MSRIILPPWVKLPEEEPDAPAAPEAPEDLTRDLAIAAIDEETEAALLSLSPSDDLRAFTLTRISRSVFGVYTGTAPPTRHPEYELVTIFSRATADAPWVQEARFVRVPGSKNPIARLDAYGRPLELEES